MAYIIIILISLLIIALIFRKNYLLLKKYRVATNVLPQQDATEEGDSVCKDPKKQLNFPEINRIFKKAEVHFSRGEFEEAEKLFIQVLSLYENHIEALNRLGVIYIQQNCPHKAELIYQKLLALKQNEPVYYSNYGRCLYNQKKLGEAAQAYEKAIELDEKRLTRLISLGQIYYELKEYEKALGLFLKAYENDERNLQYLHLIADIYELLGNTAKLKEFLEKILELDPYHEITIEKLGRLTGN